MEACIEQALDDDDVVPRWSHDRRADAIFQCHQLRHQREHVIGRVLGVEQYPVEAGHAEHLGRDRTAK